MLIWPNGDPNGPPTQASATPGGNALYPEIVFLVTWVGHDDGRPGHANTGLEVTGTVLDANGVEADPQDFTISRMGPPGSIQVEFEEDGALVADPVGNRWLAVWGSDDPGTLANNEYEAYGRFVGPIAGAAAPTGSAPARLTGARLVRRFRVRETHTRVKRLAVVGAKPGMRIELRCRGRGCPRGRRIDVTRSGTVNLKRFVRRARLRPRAVLVVRILEPGAIGRVERFRIRDDRAPARRPSTVR